MKLLFYILYFLFYFSNPDISEVRKGYPNAANSENTAKEFLLNFSDVTNDSDKVIVAYKGAAVTISSKFTRKVSDKIKIFKEGAKLVEFAVASEPNNIEIRLIRLSIQENVPKIVRYNRNKKEDIAFLLAHYKEQPTTIRNYIRTFILQSKSFTAEEKQTIK
jgi:hypothetical protein